MTIQAPAYAQILQGRLMIVRPPNMALSDLPVFTSSSRSTPVILEPINERDSLELMLPDDAMIDEIPETAVRSASFGSFTVRWEKAGSRVTRTLVLQIQRANIPAESYAAVRAFLDAFREAEKQPVVLALKR